MHPSGKVEGFIHRGRIVYSVMYLIVDGSLIVSFDRDGNDIPSSAAIQGRFMFASVIRPLPAGLFVRGRMGSMERNEEKLARWNFQFTIARLLACTTFAALAA